MDERTELQRRLSLLVVQQGCGCATFGAGLTIAFCALAALVVSDWKVSGPKMLGLSPQAAVTGLLVGGVVAVIAGTLWWGWAARRHGAALQAATPSEWRSERWPWHDASLLIDRRDLRVSFVVRGGCVNCGEPWELNQRVFADLSPSAKFTLRVGALASYEGPVAHTTPIADRVGWLREAPWRARGITVHYALCERCTPNLWWFWAAGLITLVVGGQRVAFRLLTPGEVDELFSVAMDFFELFLPWPLAGVMFVASSVGKNVVHRIVVDTDQAGVTITVPPHLTVEPGIPLRKRATR
ncbi:MAG: hypothetical protein N2512_15060 [Armatimonadetes bacterium]|nr:hypothetical protein [Armatimonadota bacterium]